MSRSKESTFLLIACLLLLAAGGGVGWFLLAPEGEEKVSAPIDPGRDLTEQRDAEALANQAAPLAPLGPRAESAPPSGPAPETTVVFPLEISLELVERAIFSGQDLESIGSGADAALRGAIHGSDGSGVAARLIFEAGPNAGRVLTCDSTGTFGASNLYPGISLLRVETPGGRVAEREVDLVSGRTQDLTVGFGQLAVVYGTVTDMAGEPLQGVSVRLDGQQSSTDDLGEFVVHGVAAGAALLILEKPGYAHYREAVGISRGGVVPKDRMSFRMAPGCTLEVTVEGNVGASGPAKLFLLPSGAERVNTERGQRTFPWHLVSPVDVFPSGSVQIEGLQEGRVHLMLFHAGAVAEQRNVAAKLVSGRPNQALLRLEPGPRISGHVRREGKPVSGARVVLEAPNRTRATVQALRQPPGAVNAMVLPHLPAARQEVKSDDKGLFLFTAYEETPRYYLTATTSDGRWRAARVVDAGQSDIELELEPAEERLLELAIQLDGRFQALPVRVKIDGAPREPFLLPPEDELRIADLVAGTWRVEVQWHGSSLLRGHRIELSDSARLAIELPEGAIAGQTEEERRRAGL